MAGSESDPSAANRGAEIFARFKLDGDRFSQGRLPVDALVELERYRQILLAAATRAWQRAHPGAQVPEDFDRQFDLTIVDVEEGSATSVLERSQSAYDDYYDAGLNETERVFSEIVSGQAFDTLSLDGTIELGAPEHAGSDNDVESPDPKSTATEIAPVDRDTLIAYALMPSFAALGSSLQPGELAEVPGVAHEPVRIDSEVRVRQLRPVVQIAEELGRSPLALALPVEKDTNSVAGRLIGLNAEEKKFRIRTLLYGELNGKYVNDELTADLKEVLNSSAQAPVVRITGDMSWRGGQLIRIRGISEVELLEIEGEAWSRRIIELASLPRGWSDDEDNSSVISFVALDAARSLMRAAEKQQFPFPGISPLEDGGVHVQWTRESSVLRVEISPDGEFELQSLTVRELGSASEQRESMFETTSDLAEAMMFVVEANL